MNTNPVVIRRVLGELRAVVAHELPSAPAHLLGDERHQGDHLEGEARAVSAVQEADWVILGAISCKRACAG